MRRRAAALGLAAVLLLSAWPALPAAALPAAGVAVERRALPKTARQSQTVEMRACASRRGHRLRPDAATAFARLCRAARADGVALHVRSSWRSAQHQRVLYQRALRRYGSKKEALRWAAFSDGKRCLSRHCSGIAVDLWQTRGAIAWLQRPAACLTGEGELRPRRRCRRGERSVTNAGLHGIVQPLPHERWHWELGKPVTP